MKKGRTLAMLLMAFLLFGCFKEYGADEQQLPVRDALITFQLKGSDAAGGLQTRATGDGTTNENKLSNLLIFCFDRSGKMVKGPQFVSISGGTTTSAKYTVKTTTDATSIYIIGNTNINAGNYNGSIFQDVRTVTALKAVEGDLFLSPVDESTLITQSSGALWMSGMSAISFGSGTTISATVQLDFIASKIEVNVTDARTNNSGNPRIVNDSVAVLFSGAKSTFFGDPVGGIATYYTGTSSKTAGTSNRTVALQPFLRNAYSASSHFYVFPQKGPAGFTMPIIVTLISRKVNGSGTTPAKMYYPVHFSTNDVFSGTFERGTRYIVNITLNGNVGNGGGEGALTPESITANAIIKIATATWTTITVEQVVN